MKRKFGIIALAALGVVSVCTSCGESEDSVVIYTASEEERAFYLKSELNERFPGVEVIFQSYDTGTLASKLLEEGVNTECDIFYDLESCNAEKINQANNELFCDLSEYDFNKYDSTCTSYTDKHKKYAVNGKTCGALVVSKKGLKEHGLDKPQTYNDLLDEKYLNSIVMPNPNSSGTGYAFYNGVVSSQGEEYALDYFNKLDKNIKDYTTSGSAPVKLVNKGEALAGVCLLWQGVEYANKNKDLDIVFLNDEASYSLFTMGMISGKETKTNVKMVFDYLYNELNEKQVRKFNPDKIYKNQGKSEIENYPTNFKEINMQGSFDFNHKKDLLDKWKH